MPQHINKCRRWVSALAVLFLLCASACSGSQEGETQPDASATPAGEMAADKPQGTRPATPPANAADVKGDELTDDNFKLSRERPFMVLMTGGNCCGNVKAAMDQLRKTVNPPLPFFIIDTSKTKEAAAAAALNVGLSKRAQKLPWAGVFDAKAETDPLAEVEKVNDNDINAATETLKIGVNKARGLMAKAGGGGQQEDTSTRGRGAEGTSSGRQDAQPDFAKLLETHKAEFQSYMDDRVDEALQRRTNAATANLGKNPAAPKDAFQTYVDSRVDESFQRKAVAIGVLAFFLLLAVALSALSLLRTQQILKNQKGEEQKAVGLEGRVQTLETGQAELVRGEDVEERMTAKLRNFVSASELRVLRGELDDVSEAIRDEHTGLLALGNRIAESDGLHGDMEVTIEDTRMSVSSAVEKLANKVTEIAKDILMLRAEHPSPGNNPEQFTARVGELEIKFTNLWRGVERNSGNANWLRDRLLKVEKELADLGPLVSRLKESAVETSGALADGLVWLGNMEAARIASSGAADEADKDKTVGNLEEMAERLQDSAAGVVPLVERMKWLVEAASERPQVSQELKDKLQGVLRDVEWFGRQEEEARRRIAALRGASVSSRYREFLSEQETLKDRFGKGELTAAQFEAAYRESFHNHFPQGAADGAAAADAELGRPLPRVEDRLMDWFSNFSQLVNRMRGANAAGPADGDTVEEMCDALNVAREVLIRFDIQPEEIEIGKTTYDPRLHVLVNWRQSSYPAHTVVDVQQSGFRRVRDGETLRRPQVIVAQASDGEHA